MPNDGARLLAGFRTLDAALARMPGDHPTSAPWMATLERFWLSGKRRLVVRKGRQGGGSTTMARVAVATALFGTHRIPPGTHLQFPFVSVTMKEARERLHNIETILDVLGEPYARREDSIELQRRPIVFAVYSCSARTARGGTHGAIWEDEAAAWWSDETSANPAAEVDAALVPGLVTQPNARIYTISSPMGLDDFHAELMARGETDHQCLAEGPSWHWNPTITEEASHDLQPDERRWRREFLAIPQAGLLSAFDPELVIESLQPLPYAYEEVSSRIYVIDAASGGADEFTGAEAAWVQQAFREEELYVWKPALHNSGPLMGTPNGKKCIERDEFGGLMLNNATRKQKPPVLCIRDMWGMRGDSYTHDSIWDLIANRCHARGITIVTGDQRDRHPSVSAAARRGLEYREIVWTSDRKLQGMSLARRLMADGCLSLLPGAPPAEQEPLRRQMNEFKEKIVNGSISYGARSGKHDDRVAILQSACHASLEGLFGPGDPVAPQPPSRMMVERDRGSFGPNVGRIAPRPGDVR
jgi:hypothetical protein